MGRGDILQFIRIQKTGGTSFLRHLRDVFPSEDVCPHHFEYQLHDDLKIRDYRVFLGHISAVGLDRYVTPSRRIFLLRDPAERLISCYYFWHEKAVQVLQASESEFFRKIAGMSLPEFLTSEDPLFRNAVFNAQARLLAGGTFGPDNHTRTSIIGPELSAESIVAAAKASIDNAYFVGITELLDKSLEQLFRKMGYEPPAAIRRDNIGLSRQRAGRPSDEVMKLIEQNIELDREIYAYAKALFLTGAWQGADLVQTSPIAAS